VYADHENGTQKFVVSIVSRYSGTQSLIRNSENRKAPKTESFFHGGRLQPKYDGHHDNDDDIDVPSCPRSSSKV
jgi:hypothetical protein